MSKLTGLQMVELNILKEFKRVAERESLTWFIMFGTLLGAVRQKGFIPWDDDIDIAIPRPEYDRLRVSSGWFEEPYFLQTPHNDPAAAPSFIRLRRSDTAVMKNFPGRYTRGGNMGAYIDIMPLDNVPNGTEAKQLSIAAGAVNRQMYSCASLDECEGTALPEWKEITCFKDGGIAGYYNLFADRHEKICTAYADVLNTPYYAFVVASGERGRRVYEKQWFSESIQMEFEGLTVPAPAGWKEVMIAAYPEGTKEPVEYRNRIAGHTSNCFVDINRPYKEYVRRYSDMLCGIDGKKVFIFGAGDSLRIWLERYSQGLDVVCAFDNSDVKWGKKAYGIPVCSPHEIPGLIDGNSRMIIASLYHKDIGKQLEGMGIYDYYVFIDGWGYKRDGT